MMKFLRLPLITTLLLAAIFTTVIYTACEKDPCTNVTCGHGGSCSNGVCRCPTGYEGAECNSKSADRFIGSYVGLTNCNGGAPFIDSVFITQGKTSIISLDIVQRSDTTKVLHGIISDNASTYAIIIPSDTSKTYSESYTLTLQDSNRLTLYTYSTNVFPINDTVIQKCQFLGYKY